MTETIGKLKELSTKDLEKVVVAHEKKVKDIGRVARIIAVKFGSDSARLMQVLEHPLSSPINQHNYILCDFYGFEVEYNMRDQYYSKLFIKHKNEPIFHAEYNTNYDVTEAELCTNKIVERLMPLINKGERALIKEYSLYLKNKRAKELDATKRKDLLERAKKFGLVSKLLTIS